MRHTIENEQKRPINYTEIVIYVLSIERDSLRMSLTFRFRPLKTLSIRGAYNLFLAAGIGNNAFKLAELKLLYAGFIFMP